MKDLFSLLNRLHSHMASLHRGWIMCKSVSTWSLWCPKSPVPRLFQQLVQANNKGDNKVLQYRPFERGIDQWYKDSPSQRILYVMFRFSTRIFYRGVPDFDDCPCRVWRPGLTTCLLYVGPLFENLVSNDSKFVSLTQWRTTFFIVCNYVYQYLNASQYDNTLFSFTLFSILK